MEEVTLERWSSGSNDPRYKVSIDPERISAGRSIFGPFLLLPVSIEGLHNKEDGRAAEDLFLIGGAMGWMDEIVLGLLIPPQIITPNNETLTVPLTDAQIAAMEDKRAGREAQLSVNLEGVASWPPNSVTQSNGVRATDTGAVRRQHGPLMRVVIHRDKWLDLLKIMGQGAKHVVELPEPKLPLISEKWREVIRLFNSAVSHHRNGLYESSLQECRRVVEGIRKVLCHSWGIDLSNKKDFADGTHAIRDRLVVAWGNAEKDRAQALKALLDAAWHWGNPSHHFGSGVPVRENSTFALELSSSLIAFAAQLLDAHPEPIATSTT